MHKYLIIITVFIHMGSAISTTFVPVPIKKQIVESDGVVQGEIVTVSSFEDDNGSIVSKAFIRADKWIGVEPVDSHIEVHFPGGTVGDRAYLVHGSPKFQTGEKIILMIKNKENSHWVQNLSLGKFSIKKFGLTDVVVNSVFPNHPEAGQMPLENFNQLVTNIKKVDFNERFKDKYELENEKQMYVKLNKNDRKIASIDSDKEIENENINSIWLIVLLGLMGGAVTLFRSKRES